MKIGNLPIVSLEQYSKLSKIKPQKPSNTSSGTTDSLELSNTALAFDKALSAAKDIPEVRTARVEAIKSQIAAGSFAINAAAIAHKIIAF